MQISLADAASSREHAPSGTPVIPVTEFPVSKGPNQGKKLSGRSALYRIRLSHCAFRQKPASFDKTFPTIFY